MGQKGTCEECEKEGYLARCPRRVSKSRIVSMLICQDCKDR